MKSGVGYNNKRYLARLNAALRFGWRSAAELLCAKYSKPFINDNLANEEALIITDYQKGYDGIADADTLHAKVDD